MDITSLYQKLHGTNGLTKCFWTKTKPTDYWTKRGAALMSSESLLSFIQDGGMITLFFCPQYLPVYTPSDAEKNDPALFANNVRRLMAK